MTTAKDILNKYLDDDRTLVSIQACMEHYAQLKLSEHSTKEPVAWMCERESSATLFITNKKNTHIYEQMGYTVTPLIKQLTKG